MVSFGTTNGYQLFSTTASEIYGQTRFRPGQWNDARSIGFLSPNGIYQTYFGIASGGKFHVKNGADVTLGTSTHVFPLDIWYYLQFRIVVHDTTGIVVLKVDGTTEISLTNVDTRGDSGTANIDRFSVEGPGSGSPHYFCDWVINDTTGSAPNNTYPDNLGCELLVPTAAGDVTQLAANGTENSYDTEVTNATAWAQYRLDETSGTTADNAEGTAARDGTYEGTPTLNQTGRDPGIRASDKAVRFDGTNDDVLLPTGAFDIATSTSAITVEAWIKLDAGTADVQESVWAGRKSTDSDSLNSLEVFQNSDGTGLRLRYSTRGDDGTGLNVLTWTIAAASGPARHDIRGCGHWHQVVCVRATDKSKQIYFDGELVASGSDSMGSGATSMDWCYIGRDRQLGAASFFAGQITELNIYLSALSKTTIQKLYGSGSENFHMVDDPETFGSLGTDNDLNTYSDNEYVSESTVDQYDLYNLNTTQWSDVAGVVWFARAKKDDAGSGAVAPVLKYDTNANGSADTENTATEQGLGTTYRYFVHYYSQQPDATAWTDDKVDALQVGVKVR